MVPFCSQIWRGQFRPFLGGHFKPFSGIPRDPPIRISPAEVNVCDGI